jgi:Putative DNA-binding domain
MLTRALSDVTLQEVQTLCDNRVLEGRFYDFKAVAIGSNERDKREFLADVTAFANAAGGDLILGVRENAGAADEICGIDLNDPDQEKQRLINLVRDGVEPRVSGLDTKWLPTSGTTGVMIIRVPRSWSAPHRVVYLKDMNFYVRNPAGKHPMSVDELRRAFVLSGSIADRMRAFREERLAASGSLPFVLQAGPRIAVLTVPMSALVDPLDLDIRVDQRPYEIVWPTTATSASYQYCLEGVVTMTPGPKSASYSLMFRTGAVECVAPILSHNPSRKTINFQLIEDTVFEAWQRFRIFAQAFAVEPPVLVLPTLISINDISLTTISVDEVPSSPSPVGVARLPEVFVSSDDISKSPELLFKKTLDVAANVFGLPRSPTYDAAGNHTSLVR